jgi:hypothetical protein
MTTPSLSGALRRLRRRAHVHVGDASGGPQPAETCYGSYEVCGEHHVHHATCGSRSLVCGRPEDRDAVAIVEWLDSLLTIEPGHVAALKALGERLRSLTQPMGPAYRHDAAVTVLEVVRHAEALAALRGPGQPYVHVSERRGP